ncbi:MAG: ribosomal protein S21 [Candidatus Xenolissoclinum pacificiensis L6]|uniref:Small ribosomal subunit protein bS21 n=1 Tax=Candidatus Xenolissoclinum pacificiensis L6 TaxID=1401685 RepID=W2V0Z6_9RICK|nr:MAG: ribosomal protein S21 [Candidatus Xenolissoclinum pacificiensis L6]
MVHHGDTEQALRQLKRSLQKEEIPANKKRIFEKPSAIKRRKRKETKRKIYLMQQRSRALSRRNY